METSELATMGEPVFWFISILSFKYLNVPNSSAYIAVSISDVLTGTTFSGINPERSETDRCISGVISSELNQPKLIESSGRFTAFFTAGSLPWFVTFLKAFTNYSSS